MNIVKWAISEPLRMIAENAGEEGAIVLGKINDSNDNNFGYNAPTGEYEDRVKAGVLDPTKVVRTALTNAGSIASPMLTTEARWPRSGREESRPAAADTAAHGGHALKVEWSYWSAFLRQGSTVGCQVDKPRPGERGFFYPTIQLP